MTINGITSSLSATADKAAGKSALDKEAFLKLLVAQISNQDPLKPMEGTEFVAQLSQFAQVEQSIAQSGHLETLSNQIGGLSNQGAADLVGSTVTVRGSTMAFDGSQPVTAGATLAGKGQVTATIKDSNGNVVRKMDLGERPAGPLPITWDGRDDQGLLKPAGSYTVEVTAVDAAGAKVGVEQDVTGKVLRVTFDKGYAALELDNGSESSVSNLVSVGTNKK